MSRNRSSLLARLGLGLACLTAASSLSASIDWSTTDITAIPKPKEAKLTREYKFTNHQPHTVRITSVNVSCPCLKASTDKYVYEPGESGTIHAVYDVGEHHGDLNNTIWVNFDDIDVKPQVLKFTASIPERVAVWPRFAYWNAKGPADTQTLAVKIADPSAVQVALADCDPGFKATLEPKSGNEYALKVTPVGTDTPHEGSAHLNVKWGEHTESVGIYLAVQQPAK